MTGRTVMEHGKTWCSERIFRLYEGSQFEQSLFSTEERKRRRVLDFLVMPGRINAKVQEESLRPVLTELVFQQFTPKQWDKIFSELSREALFCATMLSGELPEEIETAFTRLKLSLFPASANEVKLRCECKVPGCVHSAALLLKLAERLDSDPFAIFLVRGRGHDETLSELRRRRSLARPESAVPEPEELSNQATTPTAFFCAGPGFKELSYSIRADELPAALLRRLDALPLPEFEDLIEANLEDAYAQIARRAQAYGLGMGK